MTNDELKREIEVPQGLAFGILTTLLDGLNFESPKYMNGEDAEKWCHDVVCAITEKILSDNRVPKTNNEELAEKILYELYHQSFIGGADRMVCGKVKGIVQSILDAHRGEIAEPQAVGKFLEWIENHKNLTLADYYPPNFGGIFKKGRMMKNKQLAEDIAEKLSKLTISKTEPVFRVVDISKKLIHEVLDEHRDEQLQDAERTLSIAWAALRRHGWENGPTDNKADEEVHNYCQRSGQDENDKPLIDLWKKDKS